MRAAHPVERAVGIAHYVSDAPGVGGRLRESPADFRVREIEAVEAESVDADPAAYPHLVLRATLRRWDTNHFVGALSDRLGISRERVSWAGTKDKHAITTQLFSVDGVDPDDLPELSDVDLTVVGRTGRPVLFGDLAGNAFEIVVRDPDRPALVDDVTDDLRRFGGYDSDPAEASSDGEGAGSTVAVPNLFGQQRFGSRRPVTHEVGLAIARGDWERAVMTYVGNPHEREPDDTQAARAVAEETRDWPAALDAFPGHLGFERAMLHRLDERTDGGDREAGAEDYRAALEAVPGNLQRLFVNATQSSLFNRIVSSRLERGLPFHRPVEGDVVCFADRDAPTAVALPDADRTQRVTADRVASVERHCERGRAFVTAPLVGTETTLGEGEVGEMERAVLEEVGVEPADFDRPGEFNSTGTRRAIQVRTALTVERDPLTVAFALPRGSYATVVLREYLKADPGDL
jgi:tRNA pseudouridine13 synthase